MTIGIGVCVGGCDVGDDGDGVGGGVLGRTCERRVCVVSLWFRRYVGCKAERRRVL